MTPGAQGLPLAVPGGQHGAVYKVSDGPGSRDPIRYERPKFFPRDLRVIPSVHGGTFGGGYDRGHMVPNAAIGTQFGSLAQTETFLMTNMCPQKKALNQHTWADLEKWIRKRVEAPGVGHLFVIVGPIFGENPSIVSKAKYRGIQIPDAFYCIIADADEEWEDKPKIKLLAYIFPQDTPEGADFRDREKYGASVEQIQEATKLNFFTSSLATAGR